MSDPTCCLFIAFIYVLIYVSQSVLHICVQSHQNDVHDMSDPTCCLFIAFIYVLIYVPFGIALQTGTPYLY